MAVSSKGADNATDHNQLSPKLGHVPSRYSPKLTVLEPTSGAPPSNEAIDEGSLSIDA